MLKSQPDIVCLSHLRWKFVYQRPQHLMTRAARTRRVYYLEEPVDDGAQPYLEASTDGGVTVLTPHIQPGLYGDAAEEVTARLLRPFLAREGVRRPLAWVYTPMRLPLLDVVQPGSVVYDCMDELANFRSAPPKLREREQELFRQADVVFTGGHRLYEAKRRQHPNVHPFPSSVDVSHFAQARAGLEDPADQRDLPRPRLGFYGVIDERFDIELVGELARRRPEWQFVLLGPVVKIDPAELPRGENLHYLGMKSYTELPSYLAHWDVALLPFALNEATEFISPTKTPEYLAAGLPVVSTPIRDVVRPYGERGVVSIAQGTDEFEASVLAALGQDQTGRRDRADALLAGMSWDRTWEEMEALLLRAEAGPGAPRSVARAGTFPAGGSD
ncbi:glycosyltransferase family 1 protein [Deinococcus apachensis]|uniref:glycosyltransferase family 1 protein n=1 Tax=Deinococcus apachensis TaxID=309886 RepID=UPI00037C1BEF|nr:glycosyltransferase family 1 protein [Deinococcus apachensis]